MHEVYMIWTFLYELSGNLVDLLRWWLLLISKEYRIGRRCSGHHVMVSRIWKGDVPLICLSSPSLMSLQMFWRAILNTSILTGEGHFMYYAIDRGMHSSKGRNGCFWNLFILQVAISACRRWLFITVISQRWRLLLHQLSSRRRMRE